MAENQQHEENSLEKLALKFALLEERKEILQEEIKLLNILNTQMGEDLFEKFTSQIEDSPKIESIKLNGAHFKDEKPRSVSPTTKPKPRIAEGQGAKFTKWCVENGRKDLIRVEFNIGQLSQEHLASLREVASKIIAEETENSSEKSAISYNAHFQSLVSLIKEREEKNLPLPPKEVLPIFEIRTASVRRLPGRPQKKEVVQ